MNFNNLIVTVIGARGLSLKGHSELDAFVNLTLSRKGNWKSKVQTDVVRTAADCNWNQQCEFSVNDLDLVLNITANHRTTLGTADCIGALELPLRSLVSIRTPTWYRLCKKGKYSIAEQLKKYRGEVCLKFEFSNKVHSETTQNLSDPSFSVTSSRGHGKLDILKRKVQNVKKKNLGPSSDTSSFLNPSLNAINRRSSLCEVCPSPAKSPGRNSMVDFSRNGLITPPAAVPIFGDDSTSFDSRSTWITLNRNSSSNSLTCERHGRLESPVASRAHSIISSGFGSTSSTITNSLDRASIAHTLSCEQLLSKMNDLRLELAQKDAKISDLHDYIGKLLARIIEKDPEILEIESPAGIFSNNT